MKNAVMSDIDNPIKTLLDLIVKGGLIEDDRKNTELLVHKIKSQDEYINFNIYKK